MEETETPPSAHVFDLTAPNIPEKCLTRIKSINGKYCTAHRVIMAWAKHLLILCPFLATGLDTIVAF